MKSREEHHAGAHARRDAHSRHGFLSRRRFLAGSGALAATAWASPAALARPEEREPRDLLIVVFARGGLDGLTAVVPYGDPGLYAQRPTLAVPPPGAPNGAIDLDGFFGLAPSAAPLMTPFAAGDLAVVHATGSPVVTLSHFEAQRVMEVAAPSTQATIADGWIARHLATSLPTGSGDWRAAALGHFVPFALRHGPATVPIPDATDFAFPGASATAAGRRAVLESLYQAAGAPLSTAAHGTFTAIDLLAGVNVGGYVPSNGASYPSTKLGRALSSTAALFKAGVGLECVHVIRGGWDHHADMGPIDGVLAGLLDELSRALEAFYVDTLAERERYTLVVMSEFGRRVAENGSAGTDHGEGNCMMLMGGNVRGGRVVTQWPGLGGPGNGNLPVTIDYRDVLAELVRERLGNNDLATVFPGHVPSFHGLF